MPQKFSADSSSTPNSTSASVRSRSSTPTTDAERVSLRLGGGARGLHPFPQPLQHADLGPVLVDDLGFPGRGHRLPAAVHTRNDEGDADEDPRGAALLFAGAQGEPLRWR